MLLFSMILSLIWLKSSPMLGFSNKTGVYIDNNQKGRIKTYILQTPPTNNVQPKYTLSGDEVGHLTPSITPHKNHALNQIQHILGRPEWLKNKIDQKQPTTGDEKLEQPKSFKEKGHFL